MACHEIAALRLGLMAVVGIVDDAERAHELGELGYAANEPGPLKAAIEAKNLSALRDAYQASLAELEQRLSALLPGDKSRGYLQTLVVLTKKAELDLDNQIDQLNRFFRDLERMHDLVHEIYPVDQD
ncbi:MAG: hypothetical protein RL385_3359 [Pseudomonadota bacterium]|jgi:hypothetical protein